MDTIFAIVFLSLVLPSLGDARWQVKSSMYNPRSDMTATIVGNAILIAGGCSSSLICSDESQYCFCSEVSNNVDAYFPDEDRWSKLPSMPRNRFRHGAQVVGTALYIFGGRDANDAVVTEVDVFDIATEVWTTLPNNQSFTFATSDFVTFVSNNTIYVVGGYFQNYTLMSSGFTFSPDKPNAVWEHETIAPMNFPRADACSIELDGIVYIVGGLEGRDSCIPLDSVETYNINRNYWYLGHSLPQRYGNTACGLFQGRFKVLGGENRNKPVGCSKFPELIDKVFDFNPASPSKEWLPNTPLPSPRFRSVASYWKGKDYESLYVFGGHGSYTNAFPLVKIVDSWTISLDSSGVDGRRGRWEMIPMVVAVMAMSMFII